ncbi:MAG: hypothetical protein IKE89_02875 [Bacilli bacterium]|nr:hypothetical protein [Bacilli bacterium]
MGYYGNLYNSISNPLDNDAFLDYIIDCYSNNNDIYNSATKFNLSQKQYHRGEYYPDKRDAYWVKMFNIWKANVLAVSDSITSSTNYNPKHYYSEVDLANYLRSLPEIRTADEFWALANDDNNLIGIYGFQTLGQYTPWHYISSSKLCFGRHQSPHVEHRLYINCECTDTFDIASLFTDKCMERGIPFYYKFDDYANRDDSLVIYSSSKYLKYYIEILRELKKENPELFSRICDPTVLAGNIDGWIGYGSEPKKDAYGNLRSFNQVRADALKRALEKTINEWIFRNFNKVIRQGNNNITVGQILEDNVVNSIFNLYYNTFNNYKSKGQADNFYGIYGLVEADFTTGNLREHIRYNIHHKFYEFVNGGLQNSNVYFPIVIPTRLNWNLHIYYSEFEVEIKKMAAEIRRSDPSFRSDLRRNLEVEYAREGIDLQKTCFDIDKLNSLLNDDREVELEYAREQQRRAEEQRRIELERQRRAEAQRRAELERQRKAEEQRRAELERQRKAEEQRRAELERQRRAEVQRRKKQQAANAATNGVNFDKLCSMLDSSVLNKRMVLPNGKTISGKEYLKQFVFPHIPANGKFILKSGADMPYLQFIDGFVMFIGQTEYHGDFAKMMEDNVVANKGTININGNKIKATEIVNYCNPDILNKNVRFPNGKVGKFRDYVTTYFSKYIPTNGKFILENGKVISAIQYIDEYVAGVGQTKYRGNASGLLFDTTRANRGVLLDRRVKQSNELSQMLSDTNTVTNTNNIGGRRNG